MAILITGGSGFIGSKLIKVLEKNHSEIRLLSRKNIIGKKVYLCDFLIDKIPFDAFNNVDTVYHLAGCAHDINGINDNEIYTKLNTETTLELAKISEKNGVKNFIFLSSVKADNPQDIYGISKLNAERGLLEIAKYSDMRISIIRPALVYGPNVKGNLETMIKGIKKGWFPPLPNTFNKRSMIHVDDLIAAIIFIKNSKNSDRVLFTATDGIGYSSSDIYDILSVAVGKKVRLLRVPIIFFNILSYIHPSLKFKVNKLLGDDFYSSERLEKLGFKPAKSLADIYNESNDI